MAGFIKIEINTGNAAFDGEQRGPEIARILHALADELFDEAGPQMGLWNLYDVNGNRCGHVDSVVD